MSKDTTSKWTNAVAIVGGVLAAYLVYDTYQNYRARRKQEEWERRVARMTIPTKAGWTAAELSAYDGSNDTPILIGVKGKVYNVWTRPDFYGPGGGYHVFAGRDASRLLAKGILDEADDNGEELNKHELEQLDDWAQMFESKYPYVGTLAE